ncbi:unnamed protein product (macronuclear) [Paramecium tetraurelia]|uniref:Uncharacterized protein n=1 Tax=Paramecium tetraurelia TaxID=5888 RepID=A0C1Q1_PARTE|nr:uncharacterized protein GSPATT00034195001 [Paramecium tetraurelia]CAK64718.1 unnamed protein product [Paramecium tetraurelia]|eukprot:XP_001432115.1 hypothetical protein (macronuclear) [Paramecium tetraurelia strain d4-2]
MNIAEQIVQRKNEFNKQMEQRDIIQEMDDHLKNLHESDDDRSFYQMQYDQKDIQKLITLMLKYYSRQEDQTYQTKKCFYFYIWRYFQNQDIFEKNWEIERKDLEKQKRYPYRNMKKQRKIIEEQIFDLERKAFFQIRQKQILVQLFKNAARKERLIKTHRISQIYQEYCLNELCKQFEIQYKLEYIQINCYLNLIKQCCVLEGKQIKIKIEIANKHQQFQSVLVYKISEFQKQSCFQNPYLPTEISIFFYKWIKIIMYVRQLEQIEEINSINVILNQQVFKESVLRTQIQLVKSEIDSKTYLAQELLNQLLK